jgi:hypothetical protein
MCTMLSFAKTTLFSLSVEGDRAGQFNQINPRELDAWFVSWNRDDMHHPTPAQEEEEKGKEVDWPPPLHDIWIPLPAFGPLPRRTARLPLLILGPPRQTSTPNTSSDLSHLRRRADSAARPPSFSRLAQTHLTPISLAPLRRPLPPLLRHSIPLASRPSSASSTRVCHLSKST